MGWWYFARIAYWGALGISVGGFLGIGVALASTASTASTGAAGAAGAAASALGLLESREAIKPRPSLFDLYVRFSSHTALDILSLRFC